MAKRIEPPKLRQPLVVPVMPANATMKGVRVRAVVGTKRVVLLCDSSGTVYCANRSIDLADTTYVTNDVRRAWAALAGEKYADVRLAVEAEREKRKARKGEEALQSVRNDASALGYRLVRDTKRRTVEKGAAAPQVVVRDMAEWKEAGAKVKRLALKLSSPAGLKP